MAQKAMLAAGTDSTDVTMALPISPMLTEALAHTIEVAIFNFLHRFRYQ